MISTKLTILSDRLYVQDTNDNDDAGLQNKRQIISRDYSILAPVIFTVTIMNSTISAENVTQMIRNINVSSNRNEIIGFNGVGMLIPLNYMHTPWSL